MRPSRISATPKRSASGTSLSRILAPAFWLSKILDRLADVAFDDVVAQDDADALAVGEMFGQRQRVGDAAFAFLIGVVQMLQAEFACRWPAGAGNRRNCARR